MSKQRVKKDAQKNKRGKNRPRRNASRHPTPKNKSDAHLRLLQLNEFRVFGRIVIAIAFVAAVIWLARVPTEELNNATNDQSVQTNKAKYSSEAYDGLSYSDFTFYSKLADFEVKIAKDNPYAEDKKGKVYYLIQAGAFKDHQQAEEQLVILTLLDLDARVEQAGDWHRVLIGPIQTRSAMSATRERLIENGVEAQVMKRRQKTQNRSGT